MPQTDQQDHISDLRKAYQQNDLTLYLGAGVSVANGLPPWQQLVLAMYYTNISRQDTGELQWRPYSNYLFAIAEWHLSRSQEPLEITARRLRKYYATGDEFLTDLRRTLYAGYALSSGARFNTLQRSEIRKANPTLDAIAKLCEKSKLGKKGVRAVITYNYDELLETALGLFPFQPFWKSATSIPGKLPIYHVHGFVPIKPGNGSTPGEIVFTEDQYHLAAHDAYSFANLVQIQNMSGSTGLMIGLSLSDRNMRRLLDANNGLPHHPTHYALLKEPQWTKASEEQLDQINEKALKYKERFKNSGVKGAGEKGPGEKQQQWREQISAIIQRVEVLDVDQQTYVLKQLGVQPIWYKNHTEIPTILNQILKTKRTRAR